jgi:hypothetical protein
MRPNRLASAIALASIVCPTIANAVDLNPRGIGQVLIYPYYTVNKSQDTLISIANASAVGKVLQIRFLEGYNGRPVLDFRLFLSPHDVWTATINQVGDEGGAKLKTSDTSCTEPALSPDGEAFVSRNYDGSGVIPGDVGPQDITRTREGFIEVFALADIAPGSPTDIAVTHVQDGTPGHGVPPGCATLDDGTVQADGLAPTSGVFGSGSIVNVGQGTFFAYNADALQGFTDIPLLSPAGDLGVSFADANSTDARNGVATSYLFTDAGRPLALDYANGVDAVSAIFTADAIYNEYVVAPSLGANTDWVVTFPTKNFYVDKLLYPANPTSPFVEPFDSFPLSDEPIGSNVVVPTTSYDREESFQPFICETGCMSVPPPRLAYQVNVLPFSNSDNFVVGTPSGTLGSKLTTLAFPPYGNDGNATLDLASGDGGHLLSGGVDTAGNQTTLVGLPVAGFMVYNIINAQAQPGVLANYGGTFRHRATVLCVSASANCVH